MSEVLFGIRYVPHFLARDVADALLQALRRDVKWKQEASLCRDGRRHKQPWLTAWYGDPGATYIYSGVRNEPRAWTEALAQLRDEVAKETGTPFNSVLLNLYRNGDDSIGAHSDNEPELGTRPVIASVSLGATRTFVLAQRKPLERTAGRLLLEHGSLLVMNGDAQQRYVHHIPKEPAVTEARINLTFRRVFPELRQPASGQR